MRYCNICGGAAVRGLSTGGGTVNECGAGHTWGVDGALFCAGSLAAGMPQETYNVLVNVELERLRTREAALENALNRIANDNSVGAPKRAKALKQIARAALRG